MALIALPPLLVAGLVVAAAVCLHVSGLDIVIEDRFFDVTIGQFPWRSNRALEAFGHHGIRSIATAIWLLLTVGAILAAVHRPWRSVGAVLAATALAMALGPIIVVVLKSLTTFPCPWSLPRYGGFAAEVTGWFTIPSRAGHCFPAGHSAGGFSFIAIAFGLAAAGFARAGRRVLALALLIGLAATLIRMVQGAHFLSHGLWSAAIDWTGAVLVFRGLAHWQERQAASRSASR